MRVIYVIVKYYTLLKYLTILLYQSRKIIVTKNKIVGNNVKLRNYTFHILEERKLSIF